MALQNCERDVRARTAIVDNRISDSTRRIKLTDSDDVNVREVEWIGIRWDCFVGKLAADRIAK
jgi:hypothetical protein